MTGRLQEALSRHALLRWRIVVVAALGLVALAAMAWRKIPHLEDPRVDNTEVAVALPYPGATAVDVDARVLSVLDDALRELDGVESVESSAEADVARFRIKFAFGTPMELALERVRGKVLSKRKDLPDEVRNPELRRIRTGDVTQMVLAITGLRSEAVLTEAAKRLKAEMTNVPGISDVQLRGEQTAAVQVRIDPVRLARHGLAVDDVVRSLRRANVVVPGGRVEAGSKTIPLRLQPQIVDATSLGATVVTARAADSGVVRTVSLRDVADVFESADESAPRFVVDRQPAVALELRFQPNEDAVVVGQRVHERIASLPTTLPAGVALRVVQDQPNAIAASVSTFSKSLAEGVLLVMLVVMAGMGWRPALVVAAVIPLASAGAIFALYELGLSLDQISITGLIVALGLLVDDAIVVTESIQVMRDKGLGAIRAAVLGTARVFWANNVTTGIACASFLPLFAMDGPAGVFVRGIPCAVVAALVTSLAVAQVLTPCLATLVLAPRASAPVIEDDAPFDRREDSAEADEETNPVFRLLKAGYARLVPWTSRHALGVVVAFVALTVLSVVAIPRIGVQFFPKADKPLMFVKVTLPPGSSVDATSERTALALRVVESDPDVVQTSAVIGAGYPRVFVGRRPRPASDHIADVLVRLADGTRPEHVAERLRRSLAAVIGASCEVEELYSGIPVSHPVSIRVFGEDRAKLEPNVDDVKAMLRAQPGAINVGDSLSDAAPYASIAVAPERAFRVGVTANEIGPSLRALYGSDKVLEFARGGEMVRVLFDVDRTVSDPLGRVRDVRVRAPDGEIVPLRAVTETTLAHGPVELERRNGRPFVEVYADVEGGVLPSAITNVVDVWIRARRWDPGYGAELGGAREETQKSFRSLGIAAVASVLIVFVLLVVVFDRFAFSFIVLAAIPFGLIGVVLGLITTGSPFGFTAFMGAIALLGVYVNHKVYFIDRARELQDRGAPLLAAMIRAGQDRLRPVVLTAATAILGLLPVTLQGGQLWGPFGWVNIFGLLVSVPLSLVLVPAMMVLGSRLAHRRGVTESSPSALRATAT